MDVNEVRVAEDKDFEVLKIYLSRNDGWTLEYEQSKTSVWTRQASESDFKMIRVKSRFFNFGRSERSEQDYFYDVITVAQKLALKRACDIHIKKTLVASHS